MIITKLTGGLGNQMFQYAAGRALAIKNKTELKLDLTFYKNQEKGLPTRFFLLNFFNIEANPFSLKDRLGLFIRDLFFYKTEVKKIKEKFFHFDPRIISLRGNIFLEGYWQSEKYFLDIKDQIKNEFTLKKEFQKNIDQKILTDIKEGNSVSIHIRRGDYVQIAIIAKTHNCCDAEYYTKSINKMVKLINDPTFFIFSDDIGWVKNNLKINQPHIFVSCQETKDYEELYLMSQCKHQIIANSSFSWWAAWLNKNPAKVVIAPNKWFNDFDKDTKDLLPSTLLKI